MDPFIWTLLIIICTLLYFYFKQTLNYFKNRGIPYAPGTPLFGNKAELIFRRKHFSQIVLDIYNVNRDAKYIGAFDFIQPVLMLRDPEVIKAVTIKHFDKFQDRQSLVDDLTDPLMGGNLFNITGEKWKESRSLLSPAFTSSKMKLMFEPMVMCAENFAKYLAEQPQDNMKTVNTKDLFSKYTNDVIAICAYGISINSFKDPNNEFYVMGKDVTNFDGILALKFFTARAFPHLIKLLNVKFISKQAADFFINIVSQAVATRDEKGINRPDMLQLMMDARGTESKHLKHDIIEMTAQAFIFFFAGFESSSTQMCVLAHELAINPDIQKRLQNEIDEVLINTDGKPTYEAINSMAYLDAVFNETLRMHTQVAFIHRLCRSAFELPPALPGAKPFIVQPGMRIWIPVGAIHKDPKYYENPSKFDPDRYYHKKVSINDVYNLGFGIGSRSCIGNRFATLEIKVLFFFLLSKYSLVPNEKTCSPLVYSKKKFSITPEGGFSLSIISRS